LESTLGSVLARAEERSLAVVVVVVAFCALSPAVSVAISVDPSSPNRIPSSAKWNK
jgi:hypothetical protein